MPTTISNSLIAQLKPTGKQYEVRDSKLTGFLIRVNASGKMMYVCEYKRGKRISIGKVGVLTPAQARDRAKEILGDATKGVDPQAAKKQLQTGSLKNFIENEYRPWVCAHRKRGVETMARLTTHFLDVYGNKALSEIDAALIEKWRTKRLEAGKKAATINRDITALKAVLSKAVEWGYITAHPLHTLKPMQIDEAKKVRYLDAAEEGSLREVLEKRESDLRAARARTNAWRAARSQPLLPDLYAVPFADYLKPMTLLTINTGLRRGELLGLKWEDINFARQTLTVAGTTTKNGKTRHIPLNEEALHVLQQWHTQASDHKLVFPNRDGKQMTHFKNSWKSLLISAKITEFRWHDLRHHFASRLVMAGVDLNTVRELLGHSDIKMTLRYAHLAPEHKANAVAKLVNAAHLPAKQPARAA